MTSHENSSADEGGELHFDKVSFEPWKKGAAPEVTVDVLVNYLNDNAIFHVTELAHLYMYKSRDELKDEILKSPDTTKAMLDGLLMASEWYDSLAKVTASAHARFVVSLETAVERARA